jgi:hypothetical protein
MGCYSVVSCFLELINLVVGMDLPSLNEFFAPEEGAPQSYSPLMHDNLPLIGLPPLSLLRIPRTRLLSWWIISKERQIACLANGGACATVGGLPHHCKERSNHTIAPVVPLHGLLMP